jgi:predicted O-methyltransferase YrrM
MSKHSLANALGAKLSSLAVRPASLLATGGDRNEPERLDMDKAGRFVREAWRLSLGRAPSDAELAYLVGRLTAGESPMEYLLELVDCQEAVARQARLAAVTPLFVPPGHYYSPVVDPSELRTRWPGDRGKDGLPGIEMDFTAMEAMFERLMAHQAGLDFPDREASTHRYHLENDMYGIGDATILACMIRHFRPRRIIEVGSGFSSAVILDTLDRIPDLATACTFIEPYTERLDALLRPADLERVTIIRSGIQTVPLETFAALKAGDILFLDTTHISKTGSDVNHEVFEVLPRLASGVVIHFHDIFAGFEYPDEWIFTENRSWNEQYLLRAFLMFNGQFDIIYANDAFVKMRPEKIKSLCPRILENGGGGFWLRRR